MDSTAKILITFAGPYSIPAQNGQPGMTGCGVEYFFWGENGETMIPQVHEGSAVKGVRRAKANLDVNEIYFITEVPGLYNGVFEIKIGSDGKPVTTLKSVTLDENFDVSITQVKKPSVTSDKK